MPMGRIMVRKSTMVGPAQETPRRRLWLSSLDLVAPRLHMASIGVYRRGPDGGSSFMDGERMRRALAEALVPFYPLAGLASAATATGGVLFVEADAEDATVDDYGDFAPTVEIRGLAPAVVGEYTGDVSASSLLLLQVTRFKCGGVCLGVNAHHYVADGISTSHFVNSWAQLCRGARISSAPFIDRTLLRARADPSLIQHVEYLPPPPALPATAAKLLRLSAATADEAVGIFKLTRSDLARLRSRLPASSERRRPSTFAVVAAHLWRCVSLARGLPPEQPTMLLTAV
ncbi:hypothetical protein EJB05_13251, partial [Eragrostis curvula]